MMVSLSDFIQIAIFIVMLLALIQGHNNKK